MQMTYWAKPQDLYTVVQRFGNNSIEFTQIYGGGNPGDSMIDNFDQAYDGYIDASWGIYNSDAQAANNGYGDFSFEVNAYRSQVTTCLNINVYCGYWENEVGEGDGHWLVDYDIDEYGWPVYNTLNDQYNTLDDIKTDLEAFLWYIDDLVFQEELYEVNYIGYGTLYSQIEGTLANVESRLTSLDADLQSLWERLNP